MNETDSTKNKRSSFAGGICAVMLVGILLLAAGEFASYFWLIWSSPRKAQSSAPSSVYKGETWAAQYAGEAPAAEQPQYEPYVVWRHAPFSGKTINVDSDGIRKTWYTSCDKDARTIWMFGDSALWGAGSPDWETIPSFLARRYSEAGRALCVKNFGQKGWVSTQETIQLILALKQATRPPDLVVFYDGVSDSLLPYSSNVPDSHTNFDAAKTIFEEGPSEHRAGFAYLKHSNTYHVLGLLQRRFMALPSRRGSSGLSTDQFAANTLDNYQKNMDLVEILAKHYGMRCLFVWQPVLLFGDKPRSEEEQAMVKTTDSELHTGSGLLLQATYGAAKSLNRPDFHYLGDVFSGDSGTRFVDFHHASPEGNRVIADRIFTFAEQR